MMIRSLALLVLVFAACAPGRIPSASPAPVPATPPAEAAMRDAEPAEPADAAAPAEAAIASAPEHWWLLDRVSDSVVGTGVARAYRELLAGKQPRRTVVVAVIDGGVDPDHEDLDGNLWVNEDEVPGNGRDDDGNGYVDDVHGWNFIGGSDGRNVHHDTYEVTRLYAACQAGAATATLDAEQCREVESAYHAERAELESMLGQIRQMDAAMDHFTALLRQHLGSDSLTAERVAAIASPRADIQQAREVYLQLAANGITPELIKEEMGTIEDLLTYGFDPSFDPRAIVGDDYADTSERHYGNADIEGPDAGHGTHVAGIIAAERGNGIGIDGIAPAVRIMAIRAVPDGDERDKDVANAIRYAADNGAHIINMSFGKGFSPRKDAVDAAVRYAEERGILLVHAAGNDGADLAQEPSFPNRFFLDGDTARLWIEVGASSWRGPDQLAAPFSNYGRGHVHIFAPGHDIHSTVPGNDYETNSGTSMAAPVVSGIAALIMAYYPELDAAQVKDIILRSAAPLGDHIVLRPGDGQRVPFRELSATGGIIDAYAALRLAEQIAALRN